VTSRLQDHFSRLEDQQVERDQLHGFMDILLLVICAAVSGTDGWEAIEEFGKAKLQWLRQFAPFRNGIPVHDCIASVISRRSKKGFQRMPAAFAKGMRQPS